MVETLLKAALKAALASGNEYAKWVEENEARHKDLVAKAEGIAGPGFPDAASLNVIRAQHRNLF